MALMTQAVENDGGQQLLHKKSKKTSCCSWCVRCVSGLIVLLVIAGIVLCIRFFLEFPAISNGFRNAMNFTKESVDALIANIPNLKMENVTRTSEHASKEDNEPCRMYVGSFQLLNTAYVSEYSNTSSAVFQATAQCIQTLLNKIFINSPFNSSYQNASLFSVSSDPITAYFQLLFCNNRTTRSEIRATEVAKILQSYNISQQNGDISIVVNSVTVGGLAPCPLFWNAAQPWPWEVVIKVDGTAVCTGSLLTASWVLSSANCLQNRNISLLSVTLASDSSTQTVTNITHHPNFTAAPIYNNFALIRLSMPVWFNSSLTPLCLPRAVQEPTLGSVCNGSAGALLPGGATYVASTVASANTCFSSSQNGTIYITPTQIINQVSQMDTGNALVCIKTADNTSYIQGISPYLSNSSLISNTCLSYTNIGPAVDWIRSYLTFD